MVRHQLHPRTTLERLIVNGVVYQAKVHITYRTSQSQCSKKGLLTDRGANGFIFGKDTCVIDKLDKTIDVQGIDNHQLCGIALGTD